MNFTVFAPFDFLPAARQSGQVRALRQHEALSSLAGGTKSRPQTPHRRGAAASAATMARSRLTAATAADSVSASLHSGAFGPLSRPRSDLGTATRLPGEKFEWSRSAKTTTQPSGTGPWALS